MKENRPAQHVNGLTIQLLGAFVIRSGDFLISQSQWKSRRASRLVKLLALTPGHRLHRDQIIDLLWPDSELSAANNNFHQTLYGARRMLEPLSPGCMPLEDGFLSLRAGQGESLRVDVEQFEAAVEQAKDCQDPEAYQAALALYQGDLLPEDLYEEFTLARRESARQLYVTLLLALAALYRARGEYSQGIDALLRLLSTDRGHEEAHTELMRLYALNGQRQQALRQYQALRSVLRQELDAEPGERTLALYEDILSGQVAAPAKSLPVEVEQPLREAPPAPAEPAPFRPKHNLPYRVSTFIGREKEIDRVIELLRGTRLLTITGAGGVGKTSLALRAAQYLLQPYTVAGYPDGAWLVDLAPVANPALVPSSCAQTLGLGETSGLPALQQLSGYLAGKRLLLILDNCEHLLAACAQLAQALLGACPGLAILVTSREPLGLTGETIYRLPSLAVPDPAHLPPLEALGQVESIRLLMERAGQAALEIRLTEANAAAAAQICHRLDGIPLAIELAAARVRMLSLEQIAARLDGAIRLLTHGSPAALPRQQTLQATIDWSYNLLTPNERLLLQRLSVFAGGCTLEAAEQVCAGADLWGDPQAGIEMDEVLDLLGSLVSKSLVIAEPAEQDTRYRLLETIRQYAREKLKAAGGEAAARDRHLAFYARLTGQAEPYLRGKGQVEWLARLEDELDNLRAAMDWSRMGVVEKGLQIVCDLFWYWQMRGMFQEEAEWLRQLLDSEVTSRADVVLTGERALQRARALRFSLYHTGYFRFIRLAEWHANLQESIDILREVIHNGLTAPKDVTRFRRELGISLYFLFLLQERMKLPTEAARDEALVIFDAVQERFYLAEYFYKQHYETFYRGELDQSATWLEASLAIRNELEDIDGLVGCTTAAGSLALLAGDYQKAEAFFVQAAELCRQVGNRWFAAKLKVWRVLVALGHGSAVEVTRLAEEALATIREMDDQQGGSNVLVCLLRLAWSEGDTARAQELAQVLVEKHAQSPLVPLAVDLYAGRVALSQNNLSQAEALLKRAARAGNNMPVLGHETLLVGQVNLLLAWAALWASQGQIEASEQHLRGAARLFGAVDDLYRRTAPALSPRERSEHDEALAAVQAGLGEAAFARAWKAGQALTLAQAMAYVQEEELPFPLENS